MANGSANEAWDRASWHSGTELAAGAVRPIIAVMGWLNRRSLLTGLGKSVLKSHDRIEPARIALTRDHVKPAAWPFLNAHYSEWFDNFGINLAIDPELAVGDLSELDDLWDSFTGST